MELLIVNDDGIFAPGIDALLASVNGQAKIVVVAPHQERSAMSQAITVHHPLRLTQTTKGYMLDGTPADCVKMALEGLKLKPDFILSGINKGSNLGSDVFYSGTVGAALEGALHGIPSIAFSLCERAEFHSEDSDLVRKLLFEKPGFLKDPSLIPAGGILNINIPGLDKSEIKGLQVTRLGTQNYSGLMQKREDPRGSNYFWMGGYPIPVDSDDLGIDIVAVQEGYISVTPLKPDLTDYKAIPALAEKFKILGISTLSFENKAHCFG